MDDYKLGQKDLSLADNPDVMSNEELLNEIDRMSKMSIDTVDVTRIEYYLEILQNREPVMEDVDMEELWDNMVEKQPDLFAFNGGSCEPVTKKARKYVPIRFMWAAIMIVTLLMVTASAFDMNPFDTVISWTKETLIMHTNPSGEMELPEGETHAISSVSVQEGDGITRYKACYVSDTNDVVIGISHNIDEHNSIVIAEKEGDFDTYYTKEMNIILLQIVGI